MPRESRGGLRGFFGDIVDRFKARFNADTTKKIEESGATLLTEAEATLEEEKPV